MSTREEIAIYQPHRGPRQGGWRPLPPLSSPSTCLGAVPPPCYLVIGCPPHCRVIGPYIIGVFPPNIVLWSRVERFVSLQRWPPDLTLSENLNGFWSGCQEKSGEKLGRYSKQSSLETIWRWALNLQRSKMLNQHWGNSSQQSIVEALMTLQRGRMV